MSNEGAFVCYAKNPVPVVTSGVRWQMYFTNYVYITGADHPVTSTISCDFREITRLSASRFSFPYSDTSILSCFDFIFVLLAGRKTETW